MEKSIGPPPPPTGSPSVLLQYNLLRSIRVKSHTIDAINSLVDSSAIFLVKVTCLPPYRKPTRQDACWGEGGKADDDGIAEC